MKKFFYLDFKKPACILTFLVVLNIGFVSHAVPANPDLENIIGLRTELIGIDPIITESVDSNKSQANYCLNILDEAKETRNAILTKRLTGLEKEIDQKLDLMAERIDTLKIWTKRREDFLSKANDSLVQIFQSMRPDAAASQLTEIGPAMSAAIIAKLEPKYSSAILTEMKPVDAAKITMVLTNVMVTDAAN